MSLQNKVPVKYGFLYGEHETSDMSTIETSFFIVDTIVYTKPDIVNYATQTAGGALAGMAGATLLGLIPGMYMLSQDTRYFQRISPGSVFISLGFYFGYGMLSTAAINKIGQTQGSYYSDKRAFRILGYGMNTVSCVGISYSTVLLGIVAFNNAGSIINPVVTSGLLFASAFLPAFLYTVAYNFGNKYKRNAMTGYQ